MTESIHRNGCTGCDHPPEAFPLCWTEAQVSEEYARVRALMTGERLPAVARQSIPNGTWTRLVDGPGSVYQDSGANSWVEFDGDRFTFGPLPEGRQWLMRFGG